MRLPGAEDGVKKKIHTRPTSLRKPVTRNGSVGHKGDGDEGLEEPHGVGVWTTNDTGVPRPKKGKRGVLRVYMVWYVV